MYECGHFKALSWLGLRVHSSSYYLSLFDWLFRIDDLYNFIFYTTSIHDMWQGWTPRRAAQPWLLMGCVEAPAPSVRERLTINQPSEITAQRSQKDRTERSCLLLLDVDVWQMLFTISNSIYFEHPHPPPNIV